MAGEWREVTIGKFAPFSYGKGLPERHRDDSGRVPVYGSNGIVGFHSEALTLAPTVIIGRKGTVGAVHYSHVPCWPIDTTFYVIDEDPQILRFKYYLLKSLGLDRMNADSAVPGLNREAAHGRKVRISPLPEQRAIAHILGTLDDKIELNRRMSETLEAMARALFKSWFVDFDPVRAKMEGRWRRGQSLPGLPAHLYDLFPARLVHSELGEIPEGWEVKTLDSLASIQGGKQLPTEDCKQRGKFPVYGANGIMGFADRATHDGFVIAFGRVGAYCGSVNWTYGGAWINNNASSVIPYNWPEYVLQVMLTTDFEGMRTGSAQPFIPNSSLASMPVIQPTEKVLDAYCSMVAPLRLREQSHAVESRTLAALRDALLPKLVSGELRVKDAERFVARTSA